MVIGRKRHLRGAIFGLIAAFASPLLLALVLPPTGAMLLVLAMPTMFWVGYRLGSRASATTALEQALAIAKEEVPNFTVRRHLMGVNHASGILLDAKHAQFMVFEEGGKRYCVLPHAALMRCEIVEDGTSVSAMSTNRGSQLLGAAVGGMAFGGVGAVVGALTGKKTSKGRNELSEVALRVTVEDETHPLYRVVLFKVNKPVARNSAEAKSAIRSAEDAAALMAIVMRRNGQSVAAGAMELA